MLGSVATGKYVDVLRETLGERLHFPAEFVGRGDMSRGGLLLRAARSGVELAYAQAFGVPLVITTNAGLRPADEPVTLETLRLAARVDIAASNLRYRRPLLASARVVAERIGPGGTVTLLGSIASGKYVDVLLGVFGERLTFPAAFVGRGDMSRGGLLLRCVRAGEELEYVPVAGAIRHGPRPPRLTPTR